MSPYPMTYRAVRMAHDAGHPPLSAGAIAACVVAERDYNAACERLRACVVAANRQWKLVST